jgi:hypothetical protein
VPQIPRPASLGEANSSVRQSLPVRLGLPSDDRLLVVVDRSPLKSVFSRALVARAAASRHKSGRLSPLVDESTSDVLAGDCVHGSALWRCGPWTGDGQRGSTFLHADSVSSLHATKLAHSTRLCLTKAKVVSGVSCAPIYTRSWRLRRPRQGRWALLECRSDRRSSVVYGSDEPCKTAQSGRNVLGRRVVAQQCRMAAAAHHKYLC